MTIEQALIYAKKEIHSDHAKILLGDLLNLNPLELLVHLNDEVPEDKMKIYTKEIEAMKNNKPIQYVLGHVNFYGQDFYINENVLIPRFETEELVENTISIAKSLFTNPVEILDIGCGSGVIGLTLEKKLSTKTVDLVDISEKALEVTNKNCGNLNSRANVFQSDCLSNVEKKYDIIISNPPYIKDDEQIEDIVKNNEPHEALYAGQDGLDCYKKILKDISNNLKEKFLIAFEIGADQAKDIESLANNYLKDIQIVIKKDLQGRDRMIFITPNLH